MFSWSEISHVLSLERTRYGRISDNLRGWNYKAHPVKPYVMDYQVPISALAYSKCETGRDFYLRVVERKTPPESPSMKLGLKMHAIFKYSIELARTVVFEEGIEDPAELYEALMERRLQEMEKLEEEFFKKLSFRICWKCAEVLEKKMDADLRKAVLIALPSELEVEIDASVLGLSSLSRVDAMYRGIPVDLKLGPYKEAHALSIVGYALGIEAQSGLSIDAGIILNAIIRGEKVCLRDKIVYLSDDLRSNFFMKRDEALEVIASGVDPGTPAICPRDCPYYPLCRGEEDDNSSR